MTIGRTAEWRQIEALYRMTPEQIAAWWRRFYDWPGEGAVSNPKAQVEAQGRKKL